MTNTTIGNGGRFANHFFRNLAAHFIAKNNNLKFVYSYSRQFFNLGIELYKNGDQTYNEDFLITELKDYPKAVETIKKTNNKTDFKYKPPRSVQPENVKEMMEIIEDLQIYDSDTGKKLDEWKPFPETKFESERFNTIKKELVSRPT
jgi:hypothetical protein